MLEQYFGMKAKHPEAILLSRVGDFYEAYGEDAETIARALQIALTSKEAGAGKRVAMAGVPHHALSGYLARLVAQRFIVALAEQLEVPQPNRLVRRDVVRLITPGTLVEEQLLDGKQNNYLAAIAAVGETFALAYVDVSTSYSAATAIAGEDAYDELLAELARVGPVEIVADVAADLRATMATELEAIGARLATPSLGVVDARSRKTFVGFSIDESLAIHRALEALDAFVKRTGVTNGASGPAEPELYRRRQFLALDPATRKHLELTRAQGQNPRATLLATLDVCATSMGSRMLARWILAPLVDREAIAGRQDAVEAMLSEHSRREAIREILKAAFDVERIAQKVRFRRATPRDLASLRRTLLVFRPLRQAVPRALAHLLDRIGDFGEMLDDLQRTLVEEPPAQFGRRRMPISRSASRCEATRVPNSWI
jgi:DNA mismatch repair protein MutS